MRRDSFGGALDPTEAKTMHGWLLAEIVNSSTATVAVNFGTIE